jgi:MarR family 2-MHQ and catechol resistance regulon transcriptional repressor
MHAKSQTQSERMRDTGVLQRLHRNIGPDDSPKLLAVENVVHILRTYSILHDALSDALSAHDLSLAQYNLLVILYNEPTHRLQMSEIGERMSVTRTNITKLVDCLERSGLVRRADCPGDRRVVLAELTERGEALVRKVLPQHFESIRRLWNDMDAEECLQLTHLLLKLQQSALKAMGRKGDTSKRPEDYTYRIDKSEQKGCEAI